MDQLNDLILFDEQQPLTQNVNKENVNNNDENDEDESDDDEKEEKFLSRFRL